MIAELGAFALLMALALSGLQTGLSVLGRVRGDAALRGGGEGAAAAAFLAVALAFAALMVAFVTSDFSVSNVAANSHTDKPLLYKVAAVWGSHEGSMLLWDLALTGFGAAVALLGRDLPWGLKSVTVATQGALGLLFIGYTAFASNPFLRVANPVVEGRSLNPILQDPFLAIHPPFLYSGYVGFSVVFSLAVAALIEGRVDAAWARWVRPWSLAAWSLLTVGITLGSFWAYYELGWGGWWFWDPVENASFMPWLVGTALLHSATVTEKRGALTGWTVFLALCAFTFSMLGAFLVRSGVLTSVHAFAVDPTRGVILLAILALASGSGFALFAWRAPSLAPGGMFAPVSREGALILNNLFLAAATVTVMLGTLYPLIRQSLTGEAISVGGPYFALTFGPLMAACLLVLPAGPLLAWKRGDLLGSLQRLWFAGALAVGAGLLTYVLVTPRKALPALAMILGAWLIAGSLVELAGRLRLGRTGFAETWRRLKGLPRGQWGMTLAHVGLGVFVLGAAFELSWRTETAQTLRLGQSVQASGYQLRLQAVGPVEGANFTAERAELRVVGPDGAVSRMAPERRYYPANRQTTSKVAIQRHGASDLYVVLGERRADPAGQPVWLVRVFFNPWARLIFGGPLLMALGGLISLSDRRLRLGVARRAHAHARASGLPASASARAVSSRLERRLHPFVLGAALLCLAGAASDPADQLRDPAKEARARSLFGQIRCLVCQNESIDDSEASLTGDLRRIVRQQIIAGRDDAQIRAFLIQRYGEFVLLKPRFSLGNAVLWFTPFVIVGAGGALIVLRRSRPEAGLPLSGAEEARLQTLVLNADGGLATVPPQAGLTNGLDRERTLG